ncbi:hypothetical protein BDM02DRAFT_489011 [Thelephora ganbajun]|uniref:Uncharacterized protein n=1 Tax=Thelephora ganbajun TaxID=370292 RepID=A0ACB6YX04_THEGA|nr:hypothetical protein BDM02DRAFT_489011 [Thelephora ganbajun]
MKTQSFLRTKPFIHLFIRLLIQSGRICSGNISPEERVAPGSCLSGLGIAGLFTPSPWSFVVLYSPGRGGIRHFLHSLLPLPLTLTYVSLSLSTARGFSRRSTIPPTMSILLASSRLFSNQPLIYGAVIHQIRPIVSFLNRGVARTYTKFQER